MTLRLIVCTISIVFLLSCNATKSTFVATNDIVRAAQETSLYANELDWEKIEAKFIALSKDSIDTQSLKPALQYLINALGDKHATIRYANNYQLLVGYTGPKETIDNRKSDYINKVINDVESKFECGDLTSGNDRYGHLNIVGISGAASVEDEAKTMHDCIAYHKQRGVKKWIVDLRNNGGGNMNPMLAGMTPFFEDGFIGGAVDANDSLTIKLEIKNGNFYETGRIVYTPIDYPINCNGDSVVVLTSKYTTSSGEIVAVAFKNRPNTIFIGEETSGYTTGNGFQMITDDLAMIISQNYIVDRKMKKYFDKVDVDITVPFVEYINTLEDKQILEAIDWLSQQE